MIGLIVGIIFALLALGGIGTGVFFIMKGKAGGSSSVNTVSRPSTL